jgi:hypothetical protein
MVILLALLYNFQDITALTYLDAIGVSLQGFINSLVWISNPTVYAMFKKGIYEKLYMKVRRKRSGWP